MPGAESPVPPDAADAAERKRALRRRIREGIRARPDAERAREDAAILERFRTTFPAYRSACVLATLPLPDEVNLLPLLEEILEGGGRLVLPRVEERELALHHVEVLEGDTAPGAMGLREPRADRPRVGHHEVGIALVPGRAFTPWGGRLGRGGGFYDRLLERMPEARRVALAYESQIVDALPLEAHDLPVEWILTPVRALRSGLFA